MDEDQGEASGPQPVVCRGRGPSAAARLGLDTAAWDLPADSGGAERHHKRELQQRLGRGRPIGGTAWLEAPSGESERDRRTQCISGRLTRRDRRLRIGLGRSVGVGDATRIPDTIGQPMRLEV